MKTALISLAVVAVAGVPGVASAATISVDRNGTIQYRGVSTEANKLELTGTFDPFVFVDRGAPLSAGRGCTAAPDGSVACTPAPVVANLGNGDDAARVNSFSSPSASTTLNGQDGDDDLLGGSNGNAFVNGGAGDDIVKTATNGQGVGTGGLGDDQLYGNSSADVLSGGSGADLVAGGKGYSVTLNGDGGSDRIVPRSLHAAANGGDGNDLILGGQTITGGSGADQILSYGGATIDAGAGNDQVDAADGSGDADTIACGSGNDTVWADADDTVAADCEHVLAGPAPGFAGTAQALADAAALQAHQTAVN
jgi:hemolysin type calcium-binding protein